MPVYGGLRQPGCLISVRALTIRKGIPFTELNVVPEHAIERPEPCALGALIVRGWRPLQVGQAANRSANQRNAQGRPMYGGAETLISG